MFKRLHLGAEDLHNVIWDLHSSVLNTADDFYSQFFNGTSCSFIPSFDRPTRSDRSLINLCMSKNGTFMTEINTVWCEIRCTVFNLREFLHVCDLLECMWRKRDVDAWSLLPGVNRSHQRLKQILWLIGLKCLSVTGFPWRRNAVVRKKKLEVFVMLESSIKLPYNYSHNMHIQNVTPLLSVSLSQHRDN